MLLMFESEKLKSIVYFRKRLINFD